MVIKELDDAPGPDDMGTNSFAFGDKWTRMLLCLGAWDDEEVDVEDLAEPVLFVRGGVCIML